MKLSMTQFKIDQLRKDKMILTLEVIAVDLTAVIATIFLPSLLFQYVYANQQLTAEPELIKIIPAASFGIAALFTLYALLMCFGKLRKIKRLERELEDLQFMGDDCCGGDCGCDHNKAETDWNDFNLDDEDEIEDMDLDVEEVKPAKKASSSKKKTTKSAKK